MPNKLPVPDPTERPKVEERVWRMVRRWPEVSGYRLNPDNDVVAGIVTSLVRSVMTYGYNYCPCRPLTGDPEKDRVNICPCKFHHREVREQGYCRCSLFVRADYTPEVVVQTSEIASAHPISAALRQRDVHVYSTYWCPHSRRAKALLTANQVPFDNVDIEQDDQAAAQVEEWNHGFRSVPTIVIRLVLSEPSLAELESIVLNSGATLMRCDAYITQWCPDSRRAMAWLQQHGIAHRLIDIDRDEDAARQVQEWTGGLRSVPTLDLTLRITEPTNQQLQTLVGIGG